MTTDLEGMIVSHPFVLVGVLSAPKQAVDCRGEVVDEVGVRIESAAGLTDGIALAVKNDYRRKLRKLPAEALECSLIGVAQQVD